MNLRLKKDMPFFRAGLVRSPEFWEGILSNDTFSVLKAMMHNKEYDEWFEDEDACPTHEDEEDILFSAIELKMFLSELINGGARIVKAKDIDYLITELKKFRDGNKKNREV